MLEHRRPFCSNTPDLIPRWSGRVSQKKLGIDGEGLNLNGGQTRCEKSKHIKIDVASSNLASGIFEIEAYSVNKPCHPARKIGAEVFAKCCHLKEVQDFIYKGGDIVILLGNDHAHLLRAQKVIRDPRQLDK